MNSEEIAWTAFRISGSIEAYLLHRLILEKSEKSRIINEEYKGIDNKTI